MMSRDKSKKDQDQKVKEDPVEQPEQPKAPPSRGRTFGGRGTEKRG